MARFDAIGLFWEDHAPVKPPKKEKVRPIPPEPVWLNPDYLPYLNEALAFKPDLFTDQELYVAHYNREVLVWDIESYPNYFSLALRSVQSGKYLLFERDDAGLDFDNQKLKWVLENFRLVDFNGEGYDMWIAAIAVTGASPARLQEATRRIIVENERGWQVLRSMKVKRLQINHIDLMELTPLAPGLKMMAGRLHSPLMMDLPFPPGVSLSAPQKAITRWYCFNDLQNTQLLYHAHEKNIKLREEFGPRYRLDLRSKSDAQMAEAIFRAEVLRRVGRHIGKNTIVPGHRFQLRVPEYVKFYTPNLQWVLDVIRKVDFVINEAGYVKMPKELEQLVIPIGKATYKMGIGGLHSQEERSAHVAGDKWILRDHDVASYYPKLILATGMEPPLLRGLFRSIYTSIVDERLDAKHSGNKTVADVLKIVVNGSFGKTLDPHSCLYYPELGIQTTLSGQLSLLMAIERCVMAGLEVINANTDGIVVRCPVEREAEMVAIFKQWEAETHLEMETTDYSMIFSRDVNNYIAFKPNGEVKSKGIFGEGGIKKNPVNEICARAVVAYLTTGKPVEDTVLTSRDLTDFVAMRRANGGCAKVWEDGTTEFVGKIARWYHSTEVKGPIVTAKKGHMVPDTEGARPCMRLPQEFPADVDFQWYIDESYKLLDGIGYNDLIAEMQLEMME